MLPRTKFKKVQTFGELYYETIDQKPDLPAYAIAIRSIVSSYLRASINSSSDFLRA